ncbi:MAG: hypothetical protein Kow0080_21420 [Candidatus Promineifilaceae bacterium]
MTHLSSQTTRIGRASDWRFGAGILLIIGLLAFEIFNFDTTQYALGNLMGDVNFMGISWAAVLATAFCAIDLAGLMRIFKPDHEAHQETWYLMGAWLLAATMNAIMTWWAVTLTLLNHDLGNEVLSRAQLINSVPIFVAVLVWLTRILFIGALTVAGDHLFERLSSPVVQSGQKQPVRTVQPPLRRQPVTAVPTPTTRTRPTPTAVPQPRREPVFATQPPLPVTEEMPDFVDLHYVTDEDSQEIAEPAVMERPSRIHRRPIPATQAPRPIPMAAKGHR